jgi:hypothetical protein
MTSSRRDLFAMTVGLWGWRVHVLAKYRCAAGPTMMLVLQGEPWKLTRTERDIVDWVAEKFRGLDPAVMQRRLPDA